MNDIQRFHRNAMYVAIITILVMSGFFVFIYSFKKNEIDSYEAKCKALGGVVVHFYYANNCAKEGYIEVE